MYQEKTIGPKRGVSLFSYWGEFGTSMDLEDCFQDIYDMGAHGLEILANSHIPMYPELSDKWLEQWFILLDKYELIPVEYGHWVDSRLYGDKSLSIKDSANMLTRDIKIAAKLGFHIMRTKLGVIDDLLTPVENWREIIKIALPVAEEYDVRMCPELHQPTALKSRFVADYVEFIEKTGTKFFGLNVDFGLFQDKFENDYRMPGMPEDGGPCSRPEDIIPLLKYVYCCHAKFYKINDNFEETTIPYAAIINILADHGWDGYMLSEYEAPVNQKTGMAPDQLRRQHIMMKRIMEN
jgi:sugar phosphate isomerase/epimerase